MSKTAFQNLKQSLTSAALALFMAMGFPMVLWAQSESTSTVTAPAASASASPIAKPVGTSSVKTKKPAANEDFNYKMQAGLSQIAYTSPSDVDTGSMQQVEVQFNLKKSGLFFTNTEIALGTFSTENSFYYALPEAYIGYGDKSMNYTAGRKLENLSFSDTFFNFGIVQPYSTNDLVYFKTSGLTGIGAHLHSGGIGFNVSYNPIFIPNQPPQIKVEDGQVVTTNRWAPVPPKQFRLGDEDREIIYATREYKLADIVANGGYVANVFFGENKKRPTLSMTYANKPVNEIAFSRDTFADISTFSGNVILNPVVLYHQVYTADLNMDGKGVRTTLSYLGDQVDNKLATGLETMQTLSPLSIYSAYIGFDASSVVDRKMEVYLAAASIGGGDIQDLTKEGNPGSVTYATSRTRYKQPLRVGAKGETFFISNKPLMADVNFTYDNQLKGSLLSANFKYAATSALGVNVGMDLLGVENETDSTQSNFLEQNQANDRFSAGVEYVF